MQDLFTNDDIAESPRLDHAAIRLFNAASVGLAHKYVGAIDPETCLWPVELREAREALERLACAAKVEP